MDVVLPEGLSTEEIDAIPSRRFRGYDWSFNPKVHDFIDELFIDYMKWAKEIDGQQRVKNQDQIKDQLTCFVLELFRTYQSHPKLAMSVSIGNETISGYQHSRYKPHHITYKLLIHIFDFLQHDDVYIELPLGEKGRVTGASSHQRSTRVRATKALIGLIKDFGINRYMICSFPMPPECIVLRAKKLEGKKKGDDVEYDNTQFTLQARTNLERINSFLSQHHIDLKLTDEQQVELEERVKERDEQDKHQYLDLTDKQLRRIFNQSSFQLGGRFYGGFWQRIPKKYRFLITINSEHTEQYDYSGMHFAMMYANKDTEVPEGDVYQLEGYNESLRGNIKQAFNIIINCDTVPKAIATIDNKIAKGDLSEELGGGEQLLNAFKAKHPLIEEFIASGEGIKLQFIDSQIAELILLKGVENGVCILPIHDGFITTTRNVLLLKKLMEEAYQSVMGTTIEVKPESIYLELIDDSHFGLHKQITDTDGEVHEYSAAVPETLTGEVRSFSSLLSVEDVQEQMLKSKQYHLREEEWSLAIAIKS